MEKLKIRPIPPIVFGYSSILKTLWKQGELPTVKQGIYGGKLTPENISLEHINCRCYNGKTQLNNLALATIELNEMRGNKPLRFFLDSENFIAYIKQFEGVDLPKFSGKDYVEGLIKTVIKTLESGK